MFQRHKARFKDNVPDDLDTFLFSESATVPSECLECRVFEGDGLIALSYLDVGKAATSAVYGMFEPEHARRRLGSSPCSWRSSSAARGDVATIIQATPPQGESAYDYKKQLRGLEMLDWGTGKWDALHQDDSAIPASLIPSKP